VILLGAAAAVGALATAARKVFIARKEMWKGSEAKWNAKSAKEAYKEPMQALPERGKTPVGQEVNALAKRIEETHTIKGAVIQFDGFSFYYGKSRKELGPATPP
jgi:hypothetical protein